jgi:hypothetical protein
MRWKEISEAPIADFEVHGDTSQEGSFRMDDLKAMSNPKWLKKVEHYFSRVPQNINLYLVNVADFVGAVGIRFNRYRNLGRLDEWSGIRSLAEVQKIIGKVPPNAEQSITVVLVENEGDGRIPLTPWMVAHRMAHALLTPDRGDIGIARGAFLDKANTFISGAANRLSKIPHIRDELEALGHNPDVLAPIQKIQLIGMELAKFKSAQTGKIPEGREGELIVELLAQYLVQGKITFKRMDGNVEMDDFLTKIEHDLDRNANALLVRCIGKALVL